MCVSSSNECGLIVLKKKKRVCVWKRLHNVLCTTCSDSHFSLTRHNPPRSGCPCFRWKCFPFSVHTVLSIGLAVFYSYQDLHWNSETTLTLFSEDLFQNTFFFFRARVFVFSWISYWNAQWHHCICKWNAIIILVTKIHTVKANISARLIFRALPILNCFACF